jgi:uncharacterized membrane protein YkoI
MRLTLAIAATFIALASPAFADRRGHDDRAQNVQAAVSQERALEIAREQGVATVREVELEDGNWKIEGFTESGQAIEVEINAQSGAVVKRELY